MTILASIFWMSTLSAFQYLSFLTKVTPWVGLKVVRRVGAVVEEGVGALGVVVALFLGEALLLGKVGVERGEAGEERDGRTSFTSSVLSSVAWMPTSSALPSPVSNWWAPSMKVR